MKRFVKSSLASLVAITLISTSVLAYSDNNQPNYADDNEIVYDNPSDDYPVDMPNDTDLDEDYPIYEEKPDYELMGPGLADIDGLNSSWPSFSFVVPATSPGLSGTQVKRASNTAGRVNYTHGGGQYLRFNMRSGAIDAPQTVWLLPSDSTNAPLNNNFASNVTVRMAAESRPTTFVSVLAEGFWTAN
jgi:hypothetical protein